MRSLNIATIIVTVAILFCVSVCSLAEDAWVICQPDSFVYLRSKPSFGSKHVAFLEVGDKVELTGTKRGNWTKVNYECEEGYGWIFSGYLTDSEPEVYPEGTEAKTDAKQVKARRYANGPVRKKMKKGTELEVYVVSDMWSVTNLGFVQTKYLLFAR